MKTLTSRARIAAAVSPLATTLICFSHLRWDFVYQRPQHLLSRAARTHDVIYFEEPLIEEGATIGLRIRLSAEGVRVATPILPSHPTAADLAQIQRRLVDGLLEEIGYGDLITWYYTPMGLRFTAHLRPNVCIYDNMDELASFRSAPQGLKELEAEMFRRADVVFTGGHSLYQAKKNRHRNIHPFPSSIDTDHFGKARARTIAAPGDQASIPRPRIGFFGVIDERMNQELVAAVAALRSTWQLVMIGPVAKIDPAELPRAANIHWLGSKPYADLPGYLQGWDVGIMPFALNEATRFISPTKTPEFLAAGLPVVSTPITDVVRPYGEQGLVEIASDAEGFVAAITRLLEPREESWLAKVDRHLARSSWASTWEQMLDAIEASRTRTPGVNLLISEKGEARV